MAVLEPRIILEMGSVSNTEFRVKRIPKPRTGRGLDESAMDGLVMDGDEFSVCGRNGKYVGSLGSKCPVPAFGPHEKTTDATLKGGDADEAGE